MPPARPAAPASRWTGRPSRRAAVPNGSPPARGDRVCRACRRPGDPSCPCRRAPASAVRCLKSRSWGSSLDRAMYLPSTLRESIRWNNARPSVIHARSSSVCGRSRPERQTGVHPRRGSLDHTRSAGRGTARPAYVGHLLLPVRADRSVGAGPAARARVDVVPRRQRRALLARGGRRRAPAAATRRLRPGAARRGPRAAQRARGADPAGRRAGVRLRQRPLCDPAVRRRWRTDEHRVRHRPLRAPGSPQPGRAAAPHDRHRGFAGLTVARGRLDAQHAQAHRRRGARAASGRRGRDHPAVGHPGHPGHPRVDRRRPGGADRLAGSTTGPPYRLGHVARAPRSGPALVGRFAGAGRPPCRGRRSPRGSPSWWASQ